MATATDNFNRTNAVNLGANWTITGYSTDTPGIISNQVQCRSAGGRNGAWYSATAFTDNHYSQYVISTAIPTLLNGAGVRMAKTGGNRNLYAGGSATAEGFGGASTTPRLWKYVNNTVTSLGTGAATLAVGDTIRTEADGTTIRLLVNGSQQVSVTDSSLTTGAPGLWLDHSNTGVALIDNWEGGDITAAATILPPFPPRPRTLLAM